MVKFDESKTYWENKGKYKAKNAKLSKKYIPSQGINLTKNNSVNNAIMHYRALGQAYYSFYNNGTAVRGDGVYIGAPDNYSSESGIRKMEKLEMAMDKAIIRLWKVSKGGKASVILKEHTTGLQSYRED